MPKVELYKAIIQPDAAISFDYVGYQIDLKDGSSSIGIIASETDDLLTLRLMGGVNLDYPKNKIKKRSKLKNSLMLPNLHKVMSKDQLRDLVEYLASLKKAK